MSFPWKRCYFVYNCNVHSKQTVQQKDHSKQPQLENDTLGENSPKQRPFAVT